MSKNDERQKLVARIEAAFSQNNYPGDDFVIPVRNSMDLEAIELRDVFRGKNWNEISTELLLSGHAALVYFTPVGFRFYLPAFMLATLFNWDTADIVPESLILELIPPSDDDPGRVKFNERLAILTTSEKKAVRAFLEYLDKKYAEGKPPFLLPREALNKYWSRAI